MSKTCNYCTEQITGEDELMEVEGKAYHEECFDEMLAFETEQEAADEEGDEDAAEE